MKFLYFMITLLLSVTVLFADGDFRREFKVEPGQLLEVDLSSGGSVKITGWDKNEVVVEGYLEGGDPQDYKFDVEQTRSGILVDITHMGYGRRSGGLDLEVNVPREFDLEIETMGGSITIDNIDGSIEGETMGGELDLSRLNGRIKMTTMGGDIVLKESDIDGKLETMGGEVLFEDVVGDINGSSMGGDVTYRNVRKREKSAGGGGEVSISTMGGEISVDSAPSGATVSTMGGDIHIRSADEYVKAKTMGGDVDIDAVNGSAKASTMGGDVTVTMVGDPDKGDRDVDLSSMGGDITLTVPAGLSMNFDIKLTYTRRASRDYKIISDFPIELEETEDWDYSEGSARKYIFGSGKVAGGKHRIRIDTINGNIFIKKGK